MAQAWYLHSPLQHLLHWLPCGVSASPQLQHSVPTNKLNVHFSMGCPTLVLTIEVKAAEVRNLAQGTGLQSHLCGCLTQRHKGQGIVGLTQQSDQFGQRYLVGEVARILMPSPKSAPVISLQPHDLVTLSWKGN